MEEHLDARMITINASTLRRLMLFFCKVGRYTSEEVVLNLLRTKCLPVLLYGVAACPLLVRDRKSLDFTITRSFMKFFRTGSVTVVTDCQKFSYFLPVTYQIDIRTVKFLQKFQSSDNHICNLFSEKAETGVKNIFSQYGSQIHNVYDPKNFFENTFFGNDL